MIHNKFLSDFDVRRRPKLFLWIIVIIELVSLTLCLKPLKKRFSYSCIGGATHSSESSSLHRQMHAGCACRCHTPRPRHGRQPRSSRTNPNPLCPLAPDSTCISTCISTVARLVQRLCAEVRSQGYLQGPEYLYVHIY